MTATLISLISISIGIIGSNLTGYIFNKYSFDLVGNTIAGVFGSIFFIKSLGRMGFDLSSIVQSEEVNIGLFIINAIVSFFGGAIALILIYKLKNRMNKAEK